MLPATMPRTAAPSIGRTPSADRLCGSKTPINIPWAPQHEDTFVATLTERVNTALSLVDMDVDADAVLTPSPSTTPLPVHACTPATTGGSGLLWRNGYGNVGQDAAAIAGQAGLNMFGSNEGLIRRCDSECHEAAVPTAAAAARNKSMPEESLAASLPDGLGTYELRISNTNAPLSTSCPTTSWQLPAAAIARMEHQSAYIENLEEENQTLQQQLSDLAKTLARRRSASADGANAATLHARPGRLRSQALEALQEDSRPHTRARPTPRAHEQAYGFEVDAGAGVGEAGVEVGASPEHSDDSDITDSASDDVDADVDVDVDADRERARRAFRERQLRHRAARSRSRSSLC